MLGHRSSRRIILWSCLPLALTLLVGCPGSRRGRDAGALDAGMLIDSNVGGDTGPAADAGSGITISGTVAPAGVEVPAGAKVVVAWVVSSGSPDYTYKFGEGTATAAGFTVHFPGPPPVEALNDAGSGQLIGVGLVVLVPGDFTVPEGRLSTADSAALESAALGLSGQGAILWRAGTFVGEVTWPNLFPELMYSCGACMDRASGFDTFVPVECSALELVVGDTSVLPVCNWT